MGLLLLFFSMSFHGDAETWDRKYVEVHDSRLWTELKVAKHGKATLVFLNGLSYSTHQFRRLAQFIEKQDPDVGILLFDFKGQGSTLLADGLPLSAIDQADQVSDTLALLDKFNLTNVHLVGLSYGGAIGFSFMEKHFDRVKSFVAIAPFLSPDPTQDQWIKSNIDLVRQTPGHLFNFYSDDYLYDYFLRILIYAQYPVAEPILLENPFKLEATVRLVQGVRNFVTSERIEKIPKRKVHFVWASQDEYLDPRVVQRFIDALPADLPLSEVIVRKGSHKLPEATPSFLSKWLVEIARENQDLYRGQRFEARPFEGFARSSTASFEFDKEKIYPMIGLNKNTLGTNPEFLPWEVFQ